MINKEKLDVISYKFRIFTTNEQKLCTLYRELIGIVKSFTKNKHNFIGFDPFISFLMTTNQFNAVSPIARFQL